MRAQNMDTRNKRMVIFVYEDDADRLDLSKDVAGHLTSHTGLPVLRRRRLWPVTACMARRAAILTKRGLIYPRTRCWRA